MQYIWNAKLQLKPVLQYEALRHGISPEYIYYCVYVHMLIDTSRHGRLKASYLFLPLTDECPAVITSLSVRNLPSYLDQVANKWAREHLCTNKYTSLGRLLRNLLWNSIQLQGYCMISDGEVVLVRNSLSLSAVVGLWLEVSFSQLKWPTHPVLKLAFNHYQFGSNLHC